MANLAILNKISKQKFELVKSDIKNKGKGDGTPFTDLLIAQIRMKTQDLNHLQLFETNDIKL